MQGSDGTCAEAAARARKRRHVQRSGGTCECGDPHAMCFSLRLLRASKHRFSPLEARRLRVLQRNRSRSCGLTHTFSSLRYMSNNTNKCQNIESVFHRYYDEAVEHMISMRKLYDNKFFDGTLLPIFQWKLMVNKLRSMAFSTFICDGMPINRVEKDMNKFIRQKQDLYFSKTPDLFVQWTSLLVTCPIIKEITYIDDDTVHRFRTHADVKLQEELNKLLQISNTLKGALRRKYVYDTNGIVHNYITTNLIPRKYAVTFNGQAYNSRALMKWANAENSTVPHSRRPFTASERALITQRGSG